MDKEDIITTTSPMNKEHDFSKKIFRYNDNFLVPQTSITEESDIVDAFSGLLGIHTVRNSPYYDLKDLTYSYIAPSFSCSVINKENVIIDGKENVTLTKGVYIHKSEPTWLASTLFTLLLAGITNSESKYHDNKLLHLLYNHFSEFAKRADLNGEELKKRMAFTSLNYLYLKEFLVAYFSALANPQGFYTWPNRSNEHSAINDFFESFFLNHFSKMNLSTYSEIRRADFSTDNVYDKSYFFPSKFSNLVFLPNNMFFSFINPGLCKTICIPLIFDYKHSWKDLYQYKINENFDFSVEKGRKYTFMEPENYNNDSIKYEISPAILNFIAKGINFNYDVTDITWSVKDPVNNNDKYPRISIPGLKPHTCEHILYYLLEIQNYVNDKPSIYTKIFNHPYEIKTGLEDIDAFFKHHRMLEFFKEWKLHGVPEEDYLDTIGENKIVYNVIETLITCFLGKEIENADISLIDPTNIKLYPPYNEYFEGTKKIYPI